MIVISDGLESNSGGAVAGGIADMVGRRTISRPRPAMTAPVLLVDDEDERDTLRMLLGDASYAVLEASSGHTALALLRAPAPPQMVVVLNLLMRDGTGFALLSTVAGEHALTERYAYIVCARYWRGPADIGPQFAALLKRLAAPFVPKPYNVGVMLSAVAAATHQLAVAARPWTASDTA